MLEVVFGQNVDISLMMAQRYGEGPFPEGRLPGFMFYGDKEPSQEEKEKLYSDYLAKEREKWENTVPLGGNRNDIYGFDLILDIGGIGDDFIEERKRVLYRFDHAEPDQAERRIKENLERLEAFCQRVYDGEEVRLWFGRKSEDMCGMLWLCYEMVRRDLPLDKVNFIKLLGEKLSVGELRDAEWSQYAALQTLIEPEEIQFYASQWEALREADAPLRVVTDGCVLSATDDFYDEAIWQEIEKQEGDFYQTKLIGRLLDQRIGIRDSWISYRFDCFLDAGRLELVAVDHECSWIRILRKRG